MTYIESHNMFLVAEKGDVTLQQTFLPPFLAHMLARVQHALERVQLIPLALKLEVAHERSAGFNLLIHIVHVDVSLDRPYHSLSPILSRRHQNSVLFLRLGHRKASVLSLLLRCVIIP